MEENELYLVIRPVVGSETEPKFAVSISEQVPSYAGGWSNQAITDEEARADAGFSHFFTLDFQDTRLQRLTSGSSPLFRDMSYKFQLLFARDRTNAKQYRELGDYLYNLIFIDQAGLALKAAIVKAREQSNTVILRLVMGRAIINTIPWENTYCPPEEKFLALVPEVRVLRWLPSHLNWRRQKVVLPLRVLLVDCRQEDDSDALDPAKLIAALNLDGNLEAEVLLYDGSQLTKVLGEKVFHVVHFFAQVESSADVPYLVVYENRKIPVIFGMQSLTSLLYGSSVRLLTLTPVASRGTPWTVNFFGARLQETGVPAALTTQVEPSNEGFTDFIQTLYSSLAKGLPIDQALSNAQNKLAQRPSDPPGAFALFLNTRENRLFELVNPEVKEAEAWRDAVLNAVQQIVNVAGTKTIGIEVEELLNSPEFEDLLSKTKSKAEGA